VQEQLGVRVGSRGSALHVSGPETAVATASSLLEQLYALLGQGVAFYPEDVAQAARLMARDPKVDLAAIFLDTVTKTHKGRAIGPRGPGQKYYLDAIRKNDIVFAIGPAGTGKTYLAMAMAVASLMDRRVGRIILCRPAVEAGEKLGFLPGNLAEKVNPYLRPLYDALHDLMDDTRAHELVERGTIEVAPLAFMRGRTLNDAFVILDEAQNTTGEQMKMFLTRLGFGSKAVVTGDVTQVDLPSGRVSGLTEAERILEGVDGIGFCYFSDHDVVRHPLVQRVIRAYEQSEAGAAPDEGGGPAGSSGAAR
jgi:phosphate starvation-inducible protein PhoH and related proteins